MERWAGKVAIVTGASAGIGYSIAEKLTSYGLQVVGLARRVERIQELSNRFEKENGGEWIQKGTNWVKRQTPKGKLHAVKCDLTKEEDILKALNWVRVNLGQYHILINNAGIANISSFIDSDPESWQRIFDVNVIALSIFSREFIKQANNIEGHIININSGAGLRVPPTPKSMMNIYPSSKYAATALSEVIRQELALNKSKIKVTDIHPGVVQTEMVTLGKKQAAKDPELAQLMDFIAAGPSLKAEDLATVTVYALSTPPSVNVTQIVLEGTGGHH